MLELTIVTGDATDPPASGPRIIAHVCNDIGAWGRGFVHALSRRWPEPEREFKRWHADGPGFHLGAVQLVPVAPDLWVANMIAQHGIAVRDGRVRTATGIHETTVPPIRYDAVLACLRTLTVHAQDLTASVHLPRIGCGVAGGTWNRIEPLLTTTLCAADIPTTIHDLPATA